MRTCPFGAFCFFSLGCLLLLLTLFATQTFAGERFERFQGKLRSRFPDVPQLKTEELHSWMADETKKFLLLDARSTEEYQVSHLRGALSTPTLEKALQHLAKIPKEEIIVVYCSVGYRSAALVQKLAQSGFTQCYNLEGSIFEWANRGYPVYLGDQEVREVHFYNFWWGSFLDRKLWAW